MSGAFKGNPITVFVAESITSLRAFFPRPADDHQRETSLVEPGAVHRAHGGVLYIDEIGKGRPKAWSNPGGAARQSGLPKFSRLLSNSSS